MKQKIIDTLIGVIVIGILVDLLRSRPSWQFEMSKLQAQMIATRVLDSRYLAGQITRDEYTEAVNRVWQIDDGS